MEATVTCRICEQEEGCSIGWDLFEFRKPDLSDQYEHNICDECYADIVVVGLKNEIKRLEITKKRGYEIIINHLKSAISELIPEELDRKWGNRC